jgi:transposase-like protein
LAAGSAWSPEEEARLIAEWKNGATVAKLAKAHGRTEKIELG